MLHLQSLESRRLFSGGALDTTFGTTGKVDLTYKTRQYGSADVTQLVADPSGANYVVASVATPNSSGKSTFRVEIQRLLGDGSIDRVWAADTGHELIFPDAPDSEFGDRHFGVTLDPNGRLDVLVEHNVYRFNADGTPDTTWGRKGVYRLGSLGASQAIAGDGSGGLYVTTTRYTKVGTRYVGQALLTHLSARGRLDTAFARDGTFEVPYVMPASSTNYSNVVQGLRVLDSGAIMVTATAAFTLTSATDVPTQTAAEAVRVTAAGRLDRTYGTSGIAVHYSSDTDLYTGASPVAIRGDGAVLVTDTGLRDSDQHTQNFLIAADGKSEVSLDVTPLSASGTSLGTFITQADGSSLFVDGELQRLRGNGTRDKTFNGGKPVADVDAAALQYDGTVLIASANYNDGPVLHIRRIYRDDAPAAVATTRRLTRAASSYRFTVDYRDPDGIDTASLTGDELRVVTPDGTTRRPRLVRKTTLDTGVVRAVYKVTDPDGGAWDSSDNGSYAIRVLADQVNDATGIFLAKRTVGTFGVKIA